MAFEHIDVNSSQPATQCSRYPAVYIPEFINKNPNLEINFFLPYSGGGKLACSFIKSEKNERNTIENRDAMQTKNETNDLSDFCVDPSKPVVIVCHGFQSWRNQMLIYHIASGLTESLGYHTLRFDFAGNGHSNMPIDHGDQFVTHALETVVNFVHNELNCRVGCIVGHSLGAAVTMEFAVEREIKTEQNKIKAEHIIPHYVNLSGMYTPSRIDFSKMKKCSLMTIHGIQDDVVPVRNAHKIDAAVSNHKLILLEDADHNFNGLRHMKKIVFSISSFIL